MEYLTDNILAHYTTMRIGGAAKAVVFAYSEQDVVEIAKHAKDNNQRLITIGSGSNIIFADSGFDGIVLVNKISELIVDKQNNIIAAGSGVLADDIVKKAVESNLAGIEALSGIPGTIGAAPVNNIGAYGQEIKDSLVQINAYDTFTDQFIDISNKNCQFGYRDSIFKSKVHGRYIITKVLLQLKPATDDYIVPDYPTLKAELTKHNLTKPNINDIRQTILSLRSVRLPDPAQLANAGSFFKNPIVTKIALEKLLTKYPNMPYFAQSNGSYKLAAGWLIETAGLKNHRQNGFWIYDKQALVLVNESSRSFKDLMKMSDFINEKIKDTFGIVLEPEPEIIHL